MIQEPTQKPPNGKAEKINHLAFATNIKGKKTNVDCRVFMNQALC